MKTFLKNVVKFIFLLLAVVFLIELSTSFVMKKYTTFKLASKPHYLVLGHSHPQCAFNDSIIKKFKNVASSGESYFYTYFKLKKILEQNSSIETIFIEFTNNQITTEMDNWIWDDGHISSFYAYYSPFIPLNDQFVLLKNNPKGFLNSFSYRNKSKITTIINGDYDYTRKLGGYLYLVRDKTDSISKNTPDIRLKNTFATSDTIAETNLLYLQKIIQLTKIQKKNIFLIRSPLHPKYSGFKNENTYKDILNNRLNNIKYLDFSKFPLSNSEFGDLEHLNHKGAKIFSDWFNKLIENGLLLETNKQEFINNNIRELRNAGAQRASDK